MSRREWASAGIVGIVGIVGMLQAAHDHKNLGLVWQASRSHHPRGCECQGGAAKNPLHVCSNKNGTHAHLGGNSNSKNRNTRQEGDQEHQLQTDTGQTGTDEARQLAMGLSTHAPPKGGERRTTASRETKKANMRNHDEERSRRRT